MVVIDEFIIFSIVKCIVLLNLNLICINIILIILDLH